MYMVDSNHLNKKTLMNIKNSIVSINNFVYVHIIIDLLASICDICHIRCKDLSQDFFIDRVQNVLI